MNESLSIFAAFTGGLVSFFSPCVVVLLPAWLAWLAGVNLIPADQKSRQPGRLLASSLWFALGFTLVFVVLGASVGWLSSWLHRADTWLMSIGGVVMIILGIMMTGLFPVPFLNAPHRKSLAVISRRRFAPWLLSFFGGIVFSVGWTPCVSPILAGILIIAGVEGSVAWGGWLLFFYSLGLVLPLIAVSLGADRARRFLSGRTKWFKIINMLAGVILVVVGILLLTGNFSRWLSFFGG